MLNSVIAQERLNRITHFVSEINLTDFIPSASKMNDASNASVNSSYRDDEADWTSSAIPVDSAIALTAAAAGIISDDEVPSSSSKWEVSSPVSVTASEASDHSQTRGFGKDGGRNILYVDDCGQHFYCSTPPRYIIICGDYVTSATFDGALVSGKKAAETLLQDKALVNV